MKFLLIIPILLMFACTPFEPVEEDARVVHPDGLPTDDPDRLAVPCEQDLYALNFFIENNGFMQELVPPDYYINKQQEIIYIELGSRAVSYRIRLMRDSWPAQDTSFALTDTANVKMFSSRSSDTYYPTAGMIYINVEELQHPIISVCEAKMEEPHWNDKYTVSLRIQCVPDN